MNVNSLQGGGNEQMGKFVPDTFDTMNRTRNIGNNQLTFNDNVIKLYGSRHRVSEWYSEVSNIMRYI